MLPLLAMDCGCAVLFSIPGATRSPPSRQLGTYIGGWRDIDLFYGLLIQANVEVLNEVSIEYNCK
jgi:hypothetical protein